MKKARTPRDNSKKKNQVMLNSLQNRFKYYLPERKVEKRAASSEAKLRKETGASNKRNKRNA